MRRATIGFVAVIVFGVSYAVVRAGVSHTQQTGSKRILYYVDPMHPGYKSNKPGVAPDCGMPLQPVFAERSSSTRLPVGKDADVHVEPTVQRLVGIKTDIVADSATVRKIYAVGRVLPEDVRVFSINSGIDGFIRETYADSVGTIVGKDQKLAEYYAPEFLAAASGFLAANERVPGSVANEGARSIQSYSDRLRALGMSDVQIQQMAKTRQLPISIDLVSPAHGVILTRNISKGQHFEHDFELYRVADLSKVWVSAELDANEATTIPAGAHAQIGLRGGTRRMQATVTDALPRSETTGATTKIRLEVDNLQFVLRPDMLVDVTIPVHLPPGISVPADALVDTGAESRVYVAEAPNTFEPREVTTGWRTADRVQILRGLKAGERVVSQAAFLVDSESRLKSTSQ